MKPETRLLTYTHRVNTIKEKLNLTDDDLRVQLGIKRFSWEECMWRVKNYKLLPASVLRHIEDLYSQAIQITKENS